MYKGLIRKQIRLKDYDYSLPGNYFVIICTKDRECLFGEIINDEMVLSETGRMVKKWWLRLDEFIIMPNHMHGIIEIICRGGVTPPLQYKPILGQIVGYFKYQSTKTINKKNNTFGEKLWQRNYYEYIIRGEKDLDRIRSYILENPEKWDGDRNNPKNLV